MANQGTAAGLLTFLRIVGCLKRTARTGWVRSGVPDVESVSDHMYRMGVIAMVVSGSDSISSGIDKSKACKMALVHDLAEALVGDITPHDGVSKADKFLQESTALATMVSTLEPTIAEEIRALWNEYEAGDTETAKLVKDIDKFEMILQADEYERLHSGTDKNIELQDFFDSTRDVFRTDTIKNVVHQLRTERDERRKQQ